VAGSWWEMVYRVWRMTFGTILLLALIIIGCVKMTEQFAQIILVRKHEFNSASMTFVLFL
jgi:hypothetical protein